MYVRTTKLHLFAINCNEEVKYIWGSWKTDYKVIFQSLIQVSGEANKIIFNDLQVNNDEKLRIALNFLKRCFPFENLYICRKN
jgi:hypothetical protein